MDCRLDNDSNLLCECSRSFAMLLEERRSFPSVSSRPPKTTIEESMYYAKGERDQRMRVPFTAVCLLQDTNGSAEIVKTLGIETNCLQPECRSKRKAVHKK